jgi:hypothetical protein
LYKIRQSRLVKKFSKQAALWVRIEDKCNKQFFDINEGKRNHTSSKNLMMEVRFYLDRKI